MGRPAGFMEYGRRATPYRDPLERLADWREMQLPAPERQLRAQGARCMDCGVPFCQSETGCPIDNLIPEWNELVYQERWHEAWERLDRTNDFPEVTGRVCPAPCEGACVLGLIEPPVTIKNLECAIADKAFEEGWVRPKPPSSRSGKRVAVVGSGPAGLAAAAHLNRAGHAVTVHERDDRFGGLMMYGIPNMKLDKSIIERRVELIAAEGVELIAGSGVESGADLDRLRAEHDAVLLAVGAGEPRELAVPGRGLDGVHQAMEFLRATTRSLLDSELADGRHPAAVQMQDGLSAADRRVVVLGGGDTGTDCLATALRHGCRSLINLEILPRPPFERAADNPWPEWPRILRTEYGHAEAKAKLGEDPRRFALSAVELLAGAGGRVAGVRAVPVEWVGSDGGRRPHPVPGAEPVAFDADLVLLALGFLGPEKALAEGLGLALDDRGNFSAGEGTYATSTPGVFAAGDCRRGQSLVVWAIREGRGAARAIDRYLEGRAAIWPAQ